MLTSTASQYLHPDYLQPLPTTLDAKKSPLALLAQTCSNIGKDTTPAKPIIPPIEKKDQGRQSSEKHSSTDVDKRSSSCTDKKDDKPRSAPPKEVPPLVPVTSSSIGDKRSSNPSSRTTSPNTDGTSVTHSLSMPVSTPAPSAGAQSNSHISLSCGNVVLEVKHNESASSSLSKAGGLPSLTSQPLPGATLRPTPVTSASSNPPSTIGSFVDPHLMGHPMALSMDASIQSAYASALAAHANLSMMKPGDVPGLPNPAVSPYIAYAQVKTATGATTLVPICRDPYCTNCQLTIRSAQLSSCGAGCTQCTHDKSAMSVPSSLGIPVSTSVPVLPFPASGLPTVAGTNLGCSTLYPHSFLSPAHHGLPYVCNWMSGTEHCGKRFTTSEELLQHLRSHTSSSEITPALSMSSVLPTYSLPTGSSLGTYHSHLSSTGSLSPNSLHRGYPSSLSPLSALSASRYHPYKSPLTSLPSAPSAPGLSFPNYYSPYALYGQRLGPAAVP